MIILNDGRELILETSIIHPGARVGHGCLFGSFCVVEDGVVLEQGVQLGHHVIIHSGTKIGANTRIGDGCVVGRPPTPAATSTVAVEELPPLVIGESCTLSSYVILYRGTTIGDSCFFGDCAAVREKCSLGSHVLVGRGVTVENNVEIGDYSKAQTGAYITAYCKMADHVFVAPMVTTTNDNYMGRTEKRFASRAGAIFMRGCRVGGGSHLLPGVTIGEESFVATGSIVTKDVPPYQLVMGTPARVVRPVPEDELIFPRQSGSEQKKAAPAPVPSFDLKRQNAILKQEIESAINKVVTSSQFILGENVKSLEDEIACLCGAGYGIGVANGSDALYLALLACGVGPGDEVITTPFTFFATAGSIARTGAVTVFADIDEKTYNIDPEQVEARITPRTRAIMPVHLYGQSADMDQLLAVARAHNLKVVEDAAQALGVTYKERPVAGIGDAGCISFFPTKNLGCFGDGGMVVTNDREIDERARMLRVHGSRKKYYHEALGINSRLDELQAAILRVKLPHLPAWMSRRQAIAARYNELFEASGLAAKGLVRLPFVAPGCGHVYHQYTIAAQDRDRLQSHLKEQGIGSTVYYPLPLHLQGVFLSLGYKEGDFPVTERATREVLSLPMFPEMTDEETERVAQAVVEFYK
jgi:dTDP-4-amino-4,6-dideoxygalactose transaminase/acetyltransferase-like isoleucine patch superfamily enzyme